MSTYNTFCEEIKRKYFLVEKKKKSYEELYYFRRKWGMTLHANCLLKIFTRNAKLLFTGNRKNISKCLPSFSPSLLWAKCFFGISFESSQWAERFQRLQWDLGSEHYTFTKNLEEHGPTITFSAYLKPIMNPSNTDQAQRFLTSGPRLLLHRLFWQNIMKQCLSPCSNSGL